MVKPDMKQLHAMCGTFHTLPKLVYVINITANMKAPLLNTVDALIDWPLIIGNKYMIIASQLMQMMLGHNLLHQS